MMLTKTTKNQKLMKTTFYIVLTFFGLQSNLLFANGTEAQSVYTPMLPFAGFEVTNTVTEVPGISLSELKGLAPVSPAEADFSDNDLVPVSAPAATLLAPVTPKEADFNDSDIDSLKQLLPELEPKVPGEADFTDTDTTYNRAAGMLAPVNPAEATFEELV